MMTEIKELSHEFPFNICLRVEYIDRLSELMENWALHDITFRSIAHDNYNGIN